MSNIPRTSSSTNYAQNQREEFIRSRIENAGRFNRAELVEKFRVSSATAAGDVKRVMESDPAFMCYDRHYKVFLPTNQTRDSVRLAHPILKQVLALIDSSQMSQLEIQERAGYGNVMISNWRSKDHVNPTLKSITDILQVLGFELTIQEIPQNAHSNQIKPVSNPGQPLFERFRIAEGG